MSIDAINDVWEYSQAVGSARVIMLCLANYADANGVAWPSVALIAKRSKITPRNVRKHIEGLIEAGEITPAGTGIRGVVKYKITCATPVEIDTGEEAKNEASPLSKSTQVTPVDTDTCRNRHPCRERHPTPVGTDLGSPVDTDTQTFTKPSMNQKTIRGDKRGKRLDVEVLPDEWRDWAIGQGHMRPLGEWDQFRDYWISKPGQGGVKLDWFATWRNWVRNSLKSSHKAIRRNQGKTRFDALDELEAEIGGQNVNVG